jgi:hypothetical protein
MLGVQGDMQLETIKENSYKNFHAKGLHYVCLERSPLLTLKAYFFEGDISNAPEVVIPHNHRYDFTTEVLVGELTDLEYAEMAALGDRSSVAQKWDYRTPLNGGEGFEWVGECSLFKTNSRTKKPGELLLTANHKIHTIKVKPDTVLLLTQMQDKLPIGTPTQAYSFDTKEQKPNTSGLYEKFTSDELLKRLETLKEFGVAI